MCGVIEADPDAVTHNSVDDLKDAMKSAFRSNKVTHVKRSCASFRDHTEKVVTASVCVCVGGGAHCVICIFQCCKIHI